MSRITHIVSAFVLIGMLAACGQGNPSVPAAGQRSALQLTVESPDGERAFRQGEALTFHYVVTNTGAQSLSGPVILNDPPRQVSCPPLNTVGNLDEMLDFNETVTCTASYTPSESEQSAGSLASRAQAIVGGAVSNEAVLSLGQDQNTSTPFVQPSVTAFPDPASTEANPTSSEFSAPAASPTPSTGVTETPASPADATQLPSVDFTATPGSTGAAGAASIINVPVPAEGILLPGVAPAGGSIRYSLMASQGQRLTLNWVVTTGQLDLVVTGPGGLMLQPGGAGPLWSEILPSVGEYLIEVRDTSGKDAQPYLLQVQLTP